MGTTCTGAPQTPVAALKASAHGVPRKLYKVVFILISICLNNILNMKCIQKKSTEYCLMVNLLSTAEFKILNEYVLNC